jgi:Fe-S oxidoreductase
VADAPIKSDREGSLEAPTRHPLGQQDPKFYDPVALDAELTRVFEICHGCRRCFNLCNSFPTLFNLIDESATGEIDGVAKQDFSKVVEHCYLCDMCYMTKCPYVPPHPWNVDFPHLMLRAKAVNFRAGDVRWRDKVLSATDAVGHIAGIPVIAAAVNAFNHSALGRKVLEASLGVDPKAPIPMYHSKTARKQLAARRAPIATAEHTPPSAAQPGEPLATRARGKVALFATCYVNRNEPQIGVDLARIFEHNGIEVALAEQENCCGMPKLELGDLEGIARLKDINVPALVAMIERGYDIVAPVPSCVLMFKQELPLMFPDDAAIAAIKQHMFDPFEYLALRHKAGLLRTDFTRSLGKISYHVACHLRVQNIGLKTRDVLQLIPGTTVEPIERCSGHNGTYGVKKEFRDVSMKIGKPVFQRVQASGADFYASDCPMAGHQIESGLEGALPATHPLTLLRMAYGL